MFKQKKGFIAGFLTCAVISMLFVTVFARPALNWQTIDVAYADYKIFIDGERFIPEDSRGVIEPFTYNGWIYAPFEHIAKALGQSVRWESETHSLHITTDRRIPPPPRPSTRVFENSFINNNPLDERWESSGTWTFDQRNGLMATSGMLILTGFSLEEANSYTIEFESLATNHTWRNLFYISLGSNTAGQWAHNLISLERASDGRSRPSPVGNGRISYPGGTANFAITPDTWYNIKIEVEGQQVNAHVDGSLVASQRFPSLINHQFRFIGTNNYYIRNFKITIND